MTTTTTTTTTTRHQQRQQRHQNHHQQHQKDLDGASDAAAAVNDEHRLRRTGNDVVSDADGDGVDWPRSQWSLPPPGSAHLPDDDTVCWLLYDQLLEEDPTHRNGRRPSSSTTLRSSHGSRSTAVSKRRRPRPEVTKARGPYALVPPPPRPPRGSRGRRRAWGDGKDLG